MDNNNNNNNNINDDLLFDSLFAPVERIFADFDRFFSGFPSVFSIPSQSFKDENNHSSSGSLRDEVLKPDFQNKVYEDENLDSKIQKHGFDSTFPKTFMNSSLLTTMQRETTPSGRCLIEKKIQHSTNQNENTRTETISKICGDKHHTTVKENGNILREYGNATLEELNQIDSTSNDDNDRPIIGGNKYYELFKKLFS